MDTEKIFTQARENGVMAVTTAIDAVRQRNEAAQQEAETAYKAYFEDVAQREAKVKQRIADLTKRESDIKAKIAAMQPGLVNATISGDTGAFDRMQDALADLEARRAAIASQIQMLSGAAVPGNPDLYRIAAEKIKAREKVDEQCQDEIVAIRDFVKEQERAWKKIRDSLRYTRYYVPVATCEDLIKLEGHFQSQGRKPDAPAQKPKAAEEEPPVRNCETAVYRFGQM